MEKKKVWYGIWNMKCPACQQGDLFETTTFSFKKSFEMPKHCPVCNQKYETETGFYWGAMYVSYALSSFWLFSCFGFCFFLLGFGANPSFGIALVILAVLYVWVFRMSRSIWAHIFIKYNPNWNKKIESK